MPDSVVLLAFLATQNTVVAARRLAVLRHQFMDRSFHFISGLPRSGSTLLAAILRQNPKFTAGMSSPVASMHIALQQLLSAKSEYHPFVDSEKRRAVLRGIFYNYYHAVPPNIVVFDTNRAWTSKIGALAELFPASKMLCCVRPLAWIFDSFERIIRQNALEPSRIFGYEAGGNVYTRVETLNNPQSGPVGSALNGLREAFYGEHNEMLALVTYESLTKQPRETIAALYDFLGEDRFDHRFDDIHFDADEFDVRLGAPGLHSVGRRIQWTERQTLLPPDLFQRFDGTAFWSNPGQNPRRVQVF